MCVYYTDKRALVVQWSHLQVTMFKCSSAAWDIIVYRGLYCIIIGFLAVKYSREFHISLLCFKTQKCRCATFSSCPCGLFAKIFLHERNFGAFFQNFFTAK